MTTAVDTNVLFDVLFDDPDFGERSADAIRTAALEGPVIICPVVYAELATQFETEEELDKLMTDLPIRLEPFSQASLRATARIWRAYARRRGQQVQCRSCGQQFDLQCSACGQTIVWRQHVIADFLIGGHATVQADALLTRDRGYYRTYFPNLPLR